MPYIIRGYIEINGTTKARLLKRKEEDESWDQFICSMLDYIERAEEEGIE